MAPPRSTSDSSGAGTSPPDRTGASNTGDRVPGRSSSEAVPDYRGAPLDPERGPGLGCFWLQVIVLAVLLVVTPLTVVMAAPPWISATLLIISLVVLLFVGQTTIFLLRLVAADRRTRRRPRSPGARRTVGQLEDDAAGRADADDADGDTDPR